MSDTTEARPDMIGGVPTPPLAILPKPEQLFTQRADRFAREIDKIGRRFVCVLLVEDKADRLANPALGELDGRAGFRRGCGEDSSKAENTSSRFSGVA